jgi:hypothetical protein
MKGEESRYSDLSARPTIETQLTGVLSPRAAFPVAEDYSFAIAAIRPVTGNCIARLKQPREKINVKRRAEHLSLWTIFGFKSFSRVAGADLLCQPITVN